MNFPLIFDSENTVESETASLSGSERGGLAVATSSVDREFPHVRTIPEGNFLSIFVKLKFLT